MNRGVQLLLVPTGERIHDLLGVLAAAAAGHGPALLPAPEGDPDRAARIAGTLRAGTPLAGWEDDPADPTAFVVPTSGSGGEPSGALLPVSAVAASVAAASRRLAETLARAARLAEPRAGERTGGHWLLALPVVHIAGLQVLLRSVVAGTAPVVLDTARPFTAAAFAGAAARMSGRPAYTSLVPTQLRRILADPDAAAALAGFDAVLVGGAATPDGLLAQARDAGATVIPTYGMTETCGGCVYSGVPLDGVEIAIDETGETALGSTDGRISVGGDVLARGYRGRPGDPAFAVGPPRRFRTADRGILRAGRLTVLGRLDEVIVTGGVKVDPTAVERSLDGAPGVAEVVVVGVPHPEWGAAVTAVVTATPGAVPDLESLRAVAAAAHGPASAPRHLLVLPELPLLGPGKPDRRTIRHLAEQALATEW